jgi:hypothetical protein
MKISKFYLLLVLLVFLLNFASLYFNEAFELGIDYELKHSLFGALTILPSIVSAVLILSIYIYRNFPSRKK